MTQEISVTLYCQTCGNSDFTHNEDKSFLKCNVCNREYHGGIDELANYNQESIQHAVDEVGEKLLDDFAKKLETKFRNNKYIKFKRK